MPDTSYKKGVDGEATALEYLKNRGMTPLETRYHSPFGEIDLIMLDGNTLVFIEVKSRPRGKKGDGSEAVTRRKQQRLINAALHYITEHPTDMVARFDVIELTSSGIYHIVSAFEANP